MAVVSLSVHKNNLARRRGKQYRREIADCARWTVRNFDKPISGYVVVMWAGDAESIAFWEGSEDLGPVLMEDHVNTILRRAIAMRDAKRTLNIEDPDDAV